jgi:uncharacterized protein YndB with AHSA1/START domain/DNA-binding transcriptional ArsR family regulator
MDALFKALNDATRREILDLLRATDGQSLNALVDRLPHLGRFGVMKHLGVLEAASLVVTRRAGRFKYHYLNAVPLQTVIDRWIEPLLARPLSRLALDLKAHLEGETKMAEKADFVLETYIRTTPDALWNALTQPEMIGGYYIMGARPTAPISGLGCTSYDTAQGPLLSGEVLDFQPHKRLEMTFEPHWGEGARQPSRVAYEIAAEGDTCRLTILHYGIPKGQDGVRQGWAKIASGLKTLLETGTPLVMAAA